MNGCEDSRSCKARSLCIRDVLVCIGIPELLCQTEIDEVHYMGMPANTHDNVAWLNIVVEEFARVDVLQVTDLEIMTLVQWRVMDMIHLLIGMLRVEQFGQ